MTIEKQEKIIISIELNEEDKNELKHVYNIITLINDFIQDCGDGNIDDFIYTNYGGSFSDFLLDLESVPDLISFDLIKYINDEEEIK